MFQSISANAAALKRKLAKASSLQVIRQVEDINELFKMGKVIGQGAFGEVRSCLNKTTGVKSAIKIVEKAKLKDSVAV